MSDYNKIKNPITKKFLNLNNKKGKKILNDYIKFINLNTKSKIQRGGGPKYDFNKNEWYSDQRGIPGEYSRLEADVLNTLEVVPLWKHVKGDGTAMRLNNWIRNPDNPWGFEQALNHYWSIANSDDIENIAGALAISLQLRGDHDRRKGGDGRHNYFWNQMNTLLERTTSVLAGKRFKAAGQAVVAQGRFTKAGDDVRDRDMAAAFSGLNLADDSRNDTSDESSDESSEGGVIMERCVNWENGYCEYGADCRYAHACKTFDRTGRCKKFNKKRCDYFHGCKDYDSGNCRFGDNCRYAHIDDDY